MSQLPSVTGRKSSAVLGKIGFDVARVGVRHHILIHSDGRRTVVPIHSGETIGRGLLAQILRDCQITRDAVRVS